VNKKIKQISLVLVFFFLLSTFYSALAIEKISPDPKGIDLLNSLLAALSIEDEEKRLNAVIPLVHKSLLTSDGKDLDNDIKPYSYKKAYENAGCYKQPVEIYEVHKGNTTTIGYGPTAEKGRTDKYFINKKEGVAGRPAPIHIFWPADGGDPKVVNMGSL